MAEIYKKKLKTFSASLDIFVEERKRERRKQLISSGCGSASWVVPAFGPSLDFETTFKNTKAARPFAFLMFQKKVVTWCSQQSTICWT